MERAPYAGEHPFQRARGVCGGPLAACAWSSRRPPFSVRVEFAEDAGGVAAAVAAAFGRRDEAPPVSALREDAGGA